MFSPKKKYVQRKIEKTPEVKKVFENLDIFNINSNKKKINYVIPERCKELYEKGTEKNIKNREIKEEEEPDFPFKPIINKKQFNLGGDFFDRNGAWSQNKDEKYKVNLEKKYNNQEEKENEDLENDFRRLELNIDLLDDRLQEDDNVLKHKKRIEDGKKIKNKFNKYYKDLEEKYKKKNNKTPLKFSVNKDIYYDLKEKNLDKENDNIFDPKRDKRDLNVMKKVLSRIDNINNTDRKFSEIVFKNYNYSDCKYVIHKELNSFNIPEIN